MATANKIKIKGRKNMKEQENIYNVDLSELGEEKKRYTKVEKAQRTIAEANKMGGIIETLKGNLRTALEAELQMAQNSNSVFVRREAIRIATKLNKVLGE